MSDVSPQQAYPQASGGTADADTLRRLRHDLRHALYVFDLAVTLLEESRTDEERFAEVVDMLRKEQKSVSGLVEELISLASGAAPVRRQ
jgi:hypothetical protein